MGNLFKKAAVFTDLHWGLKNNSLQHNIDCMNFIDWFIQEAQANECNVGFFLGDWHNHRASINLQTLQFSVQALEKLSKAFDVFYFIPGNHDLYYRDKRDVHGVEWAKHIPNIVVVNDWFQDGDVVICPWLVQEDHKKIPKLNAHYVFGHFELPLFKMNAMVEMPDHGELKREHFSHFGHVFSGHFHMRQHKQNISYIGNAFPHNFSDAGDDKRGMMVLEWGHEPKFLSWPDQPTFRVFDLSQILEENNCLLKKNMHVKINLDVPISYEEAGFIKDTFIQTHELREMQLISPKHQEHMTDTAPGEIKFQSVDQIITDQILNIDSKNFDTKLLLEIYQTL